MFDRVTGLSDALTWWSRSGDVDPGELPDLLREDEEPAHVLANSGRIEYTRDGRTTTVQTSGPEGAYTVVTDERVLYVLGGQLDTAEIELEMTEYEASHVRGGLLTTTLFVRTSDEEVRFAPEHGDVEATQAYIDRVASCWSDMAATLRDARSVIAEFEDACADGATSQARFLDARSKLSKARHCANREEAAPEDKIGERVDEVRTEIEHRYVEAWLDRAAKRRDAVEEGSYGDACEAYVEATDAVEAARDAIETVDDTPADAAKRLADLEVGLQAAGESFLQAASTACETAVTADEPSAAVDAWEDAFERYSAAIDAGWNGEAPVDPVAIELQLTWVTTSLVDALGSQASLLETEADECADDDQAREYYDEAIEHVERAAEFAAAHSGRDPAEFEAEAARIEDAKLERSGWEFGRA